MNSLMNAAEKLARWSHDHGRRVLAAWVLLLALGTVTYAMTGTRDLDSSESFVGESGRAEVLEGAHDFPRSRTDTLLVSGDPASLDSATAALATSLRSANGVEAVSEPMKGSSGGTRALQVELKETTTLSPREQVAGMQQQADTVESTFSGIQVDATGPISVKADVTQQYSDKLGLLERASLPLTAILLYLVFAGLVAAAIPLVTGLCVVLLGMVGAGLTSFLVPADSNQPSLILLMGLALGVDYSLFFVRRLREEYASRPDVDEASRIAVSRTCHSVGIAGLTVGISVLPLLLSSSPTFRSLAVGMIVVVLSALLASMTLLPALLRLGRARLVKRRFGRQTDQASTGLLRRILDLVLSRPMASAAAGAIALLLLAAPVAVMKLGMPGTDSMPRTFQSLQTLDRVSAQYPLYGVSHTAVTPVGADRDAAVARLESLARAAASTDGFATQTRPVEVSEDGQVARIEIPISSGGIESEAARASLQTLRSDLVPTVSGGQPILIGGETAVSVDYSDLMKRDLLLIVPSVLLLSFVLITASFRSLRIATVSVVLNLMSVIAAYGAIVILFQWGWGAPLFGPEYTGPVVTLLPLMLLVVLFGLSMDYHVLILSRVQEVRRSGANVLQATRDGLLQSAPPVTAAALVMVVIFAMFTVLPTPEMKQLGTGLAVAVALDATVVRMVLLPALLVLLGDGAWPNHSRPASSHVTEKITVTDRPREENEMHEGGTQ